MAEGIALALALAGLAVVAGLAWRSTRHHAQRIAQAYAAVPVPVVVIARDDAEPLHMNAALLDLFGTSSATDPALRAQIATLGPALAGVAEPPVSAPGAAIEMEHRFERPGGLAFWVLVRATRDPLATRPAWLCTLTDVTALQQARERLTETATTDALTAVLNRRGLEQRLRVEWQRAERDGTAMSLLLLDVDQLKRLNDSHGHETGDLALAMLAATCSEALRPTDLFGRWEGEAFLAVLPGASNAAAQSVVERLRERVGALDVPVHRADGSVRSTVHISMSVGCATAGGAMEEAGPPGLPRPEDLLKAAEAALADAKRAARRSGPASSADSGFSPPGT
jgi:diguanylate cyclase (GGDEF)-like protein